MKKTLLLLILVLTTGYVSYAQDTVTGRQTLLRHEMTPEEYARRSEIGRGFVETNPPAWPVRNVAEYDRMQGALVRYPFGIPVSLIREMAEDVMVTTIVANAGQQNTVLNQYIANGVDTSHCNFLIAPSDSYWTRDYGPWFETDSADQVGIVDFPYNRPRPNDDEIPKKMAEMLNIPWFGMNVIHTGGNYMTDGYGISSSTDLVYVENPTQTAAQVDQKMENYLGITDYQVVPDPNISSTIDHIDCWSKFLAPDKILIRQTLPTDPEYNALEAQAAYWASQTCSYGYPYRVFRVKTPQDQPYTNSVILNNKVLVPFMNSPWDDSARIAYQAAMPGYEILGFVASGSPAWLSTDALHCRVMGIADIGLLHIRHIPITGNQPCENDYLVEADIIAASKQPVIADSALIRYQVNGGGWQTSPLIYVSGYRYTGMIPAQPAGSVVNYYLAAADESGRSASSPFIGPADPFTFQTVYTNLAAKPDTLWFITAEDCLYGKITQVHNYLAQPVSLNAVQLYGQNIPWWVDSISAAIPTTVISGDSVAIRVKMNLPVGANPALVFDTDSLRITTDSGSFHVIIMVNHDLLTGTGDPEDQSGWVRSYPNPFRDHTGIAVTLPAAMNMEMVIYDLNGRAVKTLWSGQRPGGTSQFTWDGKSDDGTRLAGGIYFCRVTTPGKTETVRVVIL